MQDKNCVLQDIHFVVQNTHFAMHDIHYIVQDIHYVMQDIHYVMQDIHYVVQDIHYVVQDIHYVMQDINIKRLLQLRTQCRHHTYQLNMLLHTNSPPASLDIQNLFHLLTFNFVTCRLLANIGS